MDSTSASNAAPYALARSVGRSVAAGDALSSPDLFSLAADAFGGTLAEGAFSPRDAYDAAELGLHLHLLRLGLPLGDDPEGALAEAERLSALLPSQTRRTAAQNAYQQFSTPAPYAALCAWVSGVGEGGRVIEPSAGTGALCAFALAAGATVHANELCDRRADLLASLLAEAGQGPEGDPRGALTRENADHLDAVLPPTVRADVVLMNPPFSQTAGRLGRRVVTVGTDHVLQALKRLDAGGRLVAVLSAGVGRGKPAHRPFYEAVDAGPFRLRADVEVGGAVYRPYGTSVRTRILVVDRVGEPGEGSAERVQAAVESVGEAVAVLVPIGRSARSSAGP